jgi:hypothetical protein
MLARVIQNRKFSKWLIMPSEAFWGVAAVKRR